MSASRDDLEELKAALRDRCEDFAEAMLGEPSQRGKREWRWGGGRGKAGGRSLVIYGPKRGLFIDHRTGTGGTLLDAVMGERGCPFAEAVKIAKQWLGWSDGQERPEPDPGLRERRAQQRADAEAAAAQDLARRVARAKTMAAASVPVAGTVAERYLIETRGIPAPAGGWPDSVRFYEPSRSLLLVATTDTGEVRGVQRVHLTPDGRKITAEEAHARDFPAVKHSDGSFSEPSAILRLPGPPGGPLCPCEGPETALSVWVTTGSETWAALGGLAKLELPLGRKVVVCRDDDAEHNQSDKGLRAAVDAWRRAGVDFVVATPWEARRFDRSDFNDVIQAGGVAAVRERVEAALRPGPRAPRRVPVEVARDWLAERAGRVDGMVAAHAAAVAAAMEEALPAARAEKEDRHRARPYKDQAALEKAIERLAFKIAVAKVPAPVVGLGVDVGTGKSDKFRKAVARMLRRMRAERAKGCVVFAVPRHRLGDEQAKEFLDIPEAAGLTAAVWRGREAPDPGHPDFRDAAVPMERKTKMCRDLPAVKDAQRALADVQKMVCKGKRPDGTKVECPFFKTCGYQKQLQLRGVDVWFVAHELIFSAMPRLFGRVVLLVVDEACWQDGLVGASTKRWERPSLDMEDFDGGRSILGAPLQEQDLGHLRNRLGDVIEAHRPGPLSRKAVLGAGFTQERAAEAASLEWKRRAKAEIWPGMSPEERSEALAAVKANATVRRFGMLWKAVGALAAPDGPERSGWAEVIVDRDRDGRLVRTVALRGRKALGKRWATVPTVLLDALLDAELVRLFWPQIEVEPRILVAAPHQHVIQVGDRSYSKRHLRQHPPGGGKAAKGDVDPDGADDGDDDDAADADAGDAPAAAKLGDPGWPPTRNLRRVHAIICREARKVRGKVAVIAQMETEANLLALGSLPNNVALAHHNGISGSNDFKAVALLIVIGRTAPSPHVVESIAMTLTGRAVESLPGASEGRVSAWYPRVPGWREMADGWCIPCETDQHPDPMVERVRWQVCEGELLQIVGRARGVNRGPFDPVRVLALANTPLPVPVEKVISHRDLEPNLVDLQLSCGGVAFRSGIPAGRAYPELWKSPTAAKQAFVRERMEEIWAGCIGEGKCNYYDDLGDILGIREIHIQGMSPRSSLWLQGLEVANYRLQGRGERESWAIFDPAVVGDIRKWLEERVGAVAEVSVIRAGEGQADPRMPARVAVVVEMAAARRAPEPGEIALGTGTDG